MSRQLRPRPSVEPQSSSRARRRIATSSRTARKGWTRPVSRKPSSPVPTWPHRPAQPPPCRWRPSASKRHALSGTLPFRRATTGGNPATGRTRRPFFKSRPGDWLLWSTIGVSALALALPYLGLTRWLGFVPLPPGLLLALLGLSVIYVLAAELTKRFFYGRVREA